VVVPYSWGGKDRVRRVHMNGPSSQHHRLSIGMGYWGEPSRGWAGSPRPTAVSQGPAASISITFSPLMTGLCRSFPSPWPRHADATARGEAKEDASAKTGLGTHACLGRKVEAIRERREVGLGEKVLVFRIG